MSRYRATAAEKVAAAQAVDLKHKGVTELQEDKSGLPSVEAWIANGGKVERLPSPGDCFIDRSAVIYGE